LKEYEPADSFLKKLKDKYPKIDYNQTHILKSLVYFYRSRCATAAKNA